MKILPIIIACLVSSATMADCTPSQESAEIDLIVIRGPNTVEASGRHDMMDRIAINAPAEIEDVPIVAMTLIRGEFGEIWIPLAYNINNGRAVTAISGYHDAIQNFEVAIYYENSNCKRSIQRTL